MRTIFLKHDFYALKSFLIGFLVLTGMLVPFFYSLADVPFNDNFDDYNLGSLVDQGNWECWGTPAEIVDEEYQSSPKSALFKGLCDKTGDEIVSGQITFWVKINGDYNGDNFYITLSSPSFVAIPLYWYCVGGDCEVFENIGGFPLILTDISSNIWYKYTIKWNSITDKWQMRKNDEDFGSEYNYFQNSAFIDTTNFSSGFGQGGAWLDSISGEISSFREVKFTPIYPVDCEINIDPDLIFDLEGEVRIGSDDPNKYTSWTASFINVETGEIIDKKNTFVVPMDKENNYFYYAFLDYNELTAGCWKVIYDLAGFNPDTLEQFVLFHRCEIEDKETIIGDEICIPELPVAECPEPEYDMCEELGLVEKWLCEIKNMAKEILFPTCPKIMELKNQINSFKEKFPFNYLNAIKDFFKNVKDSLNEEKSIPITLFGHEANVDFSFWQKTGEVGGLTETFSNIPKDFSRLIMIIGFLTWLLYFVRGFF